MYYKQGFYSRPVAGAVEVSDADYAELLAKQAQGWQIIDGEDGRPQAVPPAPSEYHTWDGQAWALPADAAAQLLSDARERGTEQINNAVEAVLQPLTRFEVEYTRRAAQAKAYREAGYKGEVPRQVAAFATPTGKTAKEAADIILAKSEMLYDMLDRLGELRMRKFELAALETPEAVAERTTEILGGIALIAERLATQSA